MRTVKLALGLRSTPQSLGVIGSALGAFAEQGLDLAIIREETAGPDGVRGLLAGDYDFAEFGAVPVVQAAIEGHDPLILMAAEPVSALYILGRKDVPSPPALAGGAVGVLSEDGQTGFSTREMIDRWGMRGRVRLAALGTYPRIYQAIAAGELAAGVLTADYKLAGEIAFGFVELANLGQEFGYQGPILATTRRFRDREPDTVAKVVAAYVRSIELFKTQADRVVPILRRHLGFVDETQARAIHRFYAARFQDAPFASREGIARIIDSFATQRPGARQLTPDTIYDPSFVGTVIKRSKSDGPRDSR
jgi:ABC-type nitrate/sulfonate/bicarbonate transport system substrate-binding protein